MSTADAVMSKLLVPYSSSQATRSLSVHRPVLRLLKHATITDDRELMLVVGVPGM